MAVKKSKMAENAVIVEPEQDAVQDDELLDAFKSLKNYCLTHFEIGHCDCLFTELGKCIFMSDVYPRTWKLPTLPEPEFKWGDKVLINYGVYAGKIGLIASKPYSDGSYTVVVNREGGEAELGLLFKNELKKVEVSEG